MRVRTGGIAAIAAAVAMSGSAAAAGGGSPPTVTVGLDGTSVSIQRTVPAGAVTFQTTSSEAKGGELAIIRLAPGVSVAQAFGEVQSHHGDPNALQSYASIVADALAPKGTTAIQTRLTPGRYAALDLGPSGRPPNATFTVRATGRAASLPRPGATIRAEDFRFVGARTVHTGELVRFENDGYVVHMVVAARFPSVATARRGMALLRAGRDAAAQKTAVGFADFMDSASPGAIQQERITAQPGVYVLACFMTTEDGREHTTLGMERMLRVTG